MLVSIIMPCYNGGEYICQAIESVVSQTYDNWELIIVDNGSEDDSIHKITKFCAVDSRINLFFEESKGAASARNKGIDESNGSYLAFLDSDDVWEVTKLEKTISFMKEKEVELACTSYVPFDNFSSAGLNPRVPPFIINRERLLRTCDIGCSTVVINVSRFENRLAIPRFPNIKKEDYAYWFNLIEIYKKPFFSLEKPLTKYRLHSKGISSNKLTQISLQYKIYRNHLSLSQVSALFFLFNYMLHGFRKTYLND
ncbi:glycosyltransferase family 2 protein [Aeromonas veronii]